MPDLVWLIRAVLSFVVTCAALLTVIIVAEWLVDRWRAWRRRRQPPPRIVVVRRAPPPAAEEEDWRDWPAIWP